MLYFAYGHNCYDKDMLHRVPGAVKVGFGILHGYVLAFREYATVLKRQGFVEGVLWDVPDFQQLDFYEEVPLRYTRQLLRVETPHGFKMADVYIMQNGERILPSVEYMSWLCIGYVANGISLSQLYRALIEV